MADEIYDGDWDPDAHWSTTNQAEALPGVQTPLSWSLWKPVQETGLRRGFAAIGALEKSRTAYPEDTHECLIGHFHGRVAAKVEFLGEMGDRLPGTSGAAIAEQFLGKLPDDFVSVNTRKRIPFIAAGLPRTFVKSPGRVRAARAEGDRRWGVAVRLPAPRSLAEAKGAWVAGAQWFDTTFLAHVAVNLAAVQPAYDGVLRLAASAGRPELAGKLLAGQGSHPELEMVNDLWDLSREVIDLDGFLMRHGYHGPSEGELASRVWREDPRPVHELRDQYARRSDAESPAEHARKLAETTAAAKAELMAAVPRSQRAGARLALAMGDRYMPLRGLGKAAFIQGFDMCRLAARQAGALLAEAGVVADPEDVFFLTQEELMAAQPGTSFAAAVTDRRARRLELEKLELPGSWKGRPEVRTAAREGLDRRVGAVLEGLGTSPGVVEAPVRVVTDPTFADVEEGEVLVAPVTDPAWAPIMFVASALIVDIGGLLSHASVVARELGIPCVMGTQSGTSDLRTGDVVRVDGHAGTVEILSLAD